MHLLTHVRVDFGEINRQKHRLYKRGRETVNDSAPGLVSPTLLGVWRVSNREEILIDQVEFADVVDLEVNAQLAGG